jgi:hypothetical protein
MGGICSMYRENEIYVLSFCGNISKYKLLTKYRLRWEDNIKIGFEELICELDLTPQFTEE